MPEPYGTHHTKLMAIFRQDSLAQVIIMTANLIEQDFRMSQAFWKTPLLPLQTNNPLPSSSLPMLGTGPRFKQDLLAYFRAYGPTRLQNLVGQLEMYDFTAVRGALVASVPGKQIVHNLDPAVGSLWGLPSLRRILSSIPSGSAATAESSQQPHIVAQVSSIASVGEKWLLSTLIPALSTSTSPRQPIPKPKTLVVFPTAADIRDSVDGYGSGSSIHIKTSTPAQAKQLAVLTPMLCHWAGEMPPSQTPNSNHNTNSSTDLPAGHVLTGHANRARAAPHIKTYTRFTDHTFSSIDWAMMTSANLSIQAWGSTPNASGEVRVCSYEVGVLVWPGLWDEENRRGRARIVPVFGGDTPPEGKGEAGVEVGWRLPYSLPLRPYAADERPWCAREPCDVPDWMGRVWPGYGT